MKNILITGGFGFIGFNALIDWRNRFPDLKLFNVDCETYAAQFMLKQKKSILDKLNVKSFKKNICNENSIEDIVVDNTIDTIVNFAAESHVDNSISSPKIFFDTNIGGVVNLLNICRRHKCRFHQVSTDEVIGPMLPESNIDCTEKANFNPSSPYASSKASAELIINSYVKTFNINATISRCTNNIGKWQAPEKLVPKAILNAMSNKNIPIYGDGKQRRFWIDVKSHNDALLDILRFGTTGQTYNIAPPKENLVTNIELLTTILKLMHKPTSLLKHVEDRAAHDICYWLDATKIKKQMGFMDNRKLDKILEETVNWYTKECVDA